MPYTSKKSDNNFWLSLFFSLYLTRKDFETALQKFDEIDKTKNRGLPYDEVEIWLKSKVERKSMVEIAKQIIQKK